MHWLIFRWSTVDVPKLEHRQQPIFQMLDVTSWKRSWFDEISGVHLHHFFGFADSLVCKTIREICWVGIEPDGILLYCLDVPLYRFHLSSSGVYSPQEQEIYVKFGSTQKEPPNLISRRPEQDGSMNWECVKNLGLWENRETDLGTEESQTSCLECVVWHLSVKGEDC